MKRLTTPRYHQRGAVAIMFGLSVFVLFGFMALAIDLGRTYVVRTELQNAADAAALAGAKQLNQTQKGVWDSVNPNSSAVGRAINIAAKNNFKFSTPVAITIANMSVGSCPEDECMVPAINITSDALAAGMTFLKVDIPSGGLASFFAVVPTTAAGTGIPSTSTYGHAVAGRFVNDVTPIGVCAIDLVSGGTITHGGLTELTEYGFRRGVSYNVFDLGPLGVASDPYLLNPVNVPPSSCGGGPAPDSAQATAPFLCSGVSAVIAGTPTVANPIHVYGNTGLNATPSQKALNTRFGGGLPSQCTSALSDINIRDYPCTSASCPKNAIPGQPTSSPAAYPNIWMDPTDTITPNARQTINLAGIASKDDYGVLWSYSRAAKALGTSPNATADTNSFFTPNDWPTLYPGLTADPTYPGGLAGTSGAPYSATGSVYDQPKTGGVKNRRVLNLAIVNCPNVNPAGNCHYDIPVVGIGRFFMQVPASLTGTPKRLEVEFAGLVEPIPLAEIRLYR